jgi:hypothetical protein
MNRWICPMFLALVCAACTKLHTTSNSHGRVNHIVVAWLKNPGNEADRQKLIDTSRKFLQIPGVINVSAGRAVPSTRPVVDSTFDVAVVIVFRDEAALRSYDVHPIHRQAVDEVLKPLVKKQIVYDLSDAQ